MKARHEGIAHAATQAFNNGHVLDIRGRDVATRILMSPAGRIFQNEAWWLEGNALKKFKDDVVTPFGKDEALDALVLLGVLWKEEKDLNMEVLRLKMSRGQNNDISSSSQGEGDHDASTSIVKECAPPQRRRHVGETLARQVIRSKRLAFAKSNAFLTGNVFFEEAHDQFCTNKNFDSFEDQRQKKIFSGVLDDIGSTSHGPGRTNLCTNNGCSSSTNCPGIKDSFVVGDRVSKNTSFAGQLQLFQEKNRVR